jgi:hypothetical protein
MCRGIAGTIDRLARLTRSQRRHFGAYRRNTPNRCARISIDFAVPIPGVRKRARRIGLTIARKIY